MKANENDQEQVQLEGGTYEIIRERLREHGALLRERLGLLNQARKDTFGAIETKLLRSQRVTTENNCVPRDIVPIGNHFLFGYNVHLGLRSETHLKDVFAIYSFDETGFHDQGLDSILSEKFQSDFQNLYKYYKHTTFSKFAIIGANLFMIFRTGKSVNDFKTFKWAIGDQGLTYIDNRSDHEFKYPSQHEFEWTRARRDDFRMGEHPHVSILDRVFVETVGGDLTIKVEDNTEDGSGIYEEPVDHADQTLDDAEIFYASLGHCILLKILPYQEKNYRYFVFNEKLQEAHRIDAIEDTCVLLPDGHGIIFPKGYYLLTGELKEFDSDFSSMTFEKRIASSNGEDTLFLFYNRDNGLYILLSYNMIEQRVATPIACHGYSFFEDGTMLFFRSEDQPNKHHAIQVWQTPYTGPNYVQESHSESPIYNIGNKDIVRCMAECHEVLKLLGKDDVYANLYLDIAKKCTDIGDSYFWLNDDAAGNLSEPLAKIGEAADAAISEFEKVTRIKKATREEIARVGRKADDLFKEIGRSGLKKVDEFVAYLAQLRTLRGEIISCRERRYVDLSRVEELEQLATEQTDKLSQGCVVFLLKDEALDPYLQRVAKQEQEVGELTKVADAKLLEEALDQTGRDLELLIEIVSNLKIDDPTQTTRIIDSVSAIFADLNRVRTALKNRRQDMAKVEGVAEFNAQIKLLGQSVVNYLDVCDTPDKCESYLTKLTVQIEELEGRFSEFDEFVAELTEKREEVYNAFEAKRLQLVEARNKRASALFGSAQRILTGIRSRVSRFEDVNDINGYFAGDLMVDKARNIIAQLTEMDETVKADDLQVQLKTIREEAVRQLKDKNELFEGGNLIKLGSHRFSVNTQSLALTTVYKDGAQFFHLSGTDFFEEMTHTDFVSTKPVWDMEVISEDPALYRAEFLAWQMLKTIDDGDSLGLVDADEQGLLEQVRIFMGPRYEEGYAKGVHDLDAAQLLKALVVLRTQLGLLSFPAPARALAMLFWERFCDAKIKGNIAATCGGLSSLMELFPDSRASDRHVLQLQGLMSSFVAQEGFFDERLVGDAARYLFAQLTKGGPYAISQEAGVLCRGFLSYLDHRSFKTKFESSLYELRDNPAKGYLLAREWLAAFCTSQMNEHRGFIDEASVLIFCDAYQPEAVADLSTQIQLKELKGSHPLLQKGAYHFNYNDYCHRLATYEATVVPTFRQYTHLKKSLCEAFTEELRLSEFKPRVLTSFVRNRLLDEVYLPLIGDNFAKQIGAAGDNTRTDRMGMLLLLSPPGYGKTTLMEYLANRLGLIFMKINGPAIGHEVTSLDPAAAGHSAAREELKKLNLSLEMGDNVMIYLDDIQHCNPEFLQKFISLCDGQRKIEGVYKGRTRTYDLRGKKVCVVMAGNPYTESGDKFQIPDMLANRADTYNLGDIVGGNAKAFELSYIENSLTSSPVLNKLASRSQKDVLALIKIAETGDREGVELEGNYSGEEVNEFLSVLKKLFRIRDVILRVNLEYVRSAAMEDAYRTEPAFKLQGSYRNMNKIVEKVLPIMNDEELENLIRNHYDNEAQTLTSSAEANLLKFQELCGTMTPESEARWQAIKRTFQQKQKMLGVDGDDKVGQVVLQLSHFSSGLDAIRDTLVKVAEKNADHHSQVAAQNAQQMAEQAKLTAQMLQNVMANQESKPVEVQREPMFGDGILKTETQLSAESLSQLSEALKPTMVHLGRVLAKSLGQTQVQPKPPSNQATAINDDLEPFKAVAQMLRKQFDIMAHWIKPTYETAIEQDKHMRELTASINALMSTHGSLLGYLNQFEERKKTQ